jgi:hypothetical protein
MIQITKYKAQRHLHEPQSARSLSLGAAAAAFWILDFHTNSKQQTETAEKQKANMQHATCDKHHHFLFFEQPLFSFSFDMHPQNMKMQIRINTLHAHNTTYNITNHNTTFNINAVKAHKTHHARSRVFFFFFFFFFRYAPSKHENADSD